VIPGGGVGALVQESADGIVRIEADLTIHPAAAVKPSSDVPATPPESAPKNSDPPSPSAKVP
jgi:hypothetical protein